MEISHKIIVATTNIPVQLQHAIDSLKAGKAIIDEIHDLKKNVTAVKAKVDVSLCIASGFVVRRIQLTHCTTAN